MTVTGKGGERRGRAARAVAVGDARLCLFVCTLSFFLPLVVLPGGLRQGWGRGFSLDNLTLRNFRYVLFEQRPTRTAIVQHLPVRRRGLADRARCWRSPSPTSCSGGWCRWAACCRFLAMAPFVIPGIVLAIGFYAAYTRPPLVLYGTRGS